MANQRAGILGTGHAYPERDSDERRPRKDRRNFDEWITTRTGIRQRKKLR